MTTSIIVEDHHALVGAAADWLARAIARCIASRHSCSLALSGGSTPRPAYERLAERSASPAIAWPSVTVYFGDERCVPPDDPRSNFRMADDALLGRVAIDPAHVHRMAGERRDHAAAAADYDHLLPDRIDIVILGVGPEGHTASLFPHSSALGEHERRVVAVTVPADPPERLTITPPVLAAARELLVLASGLAKAEVVAAALEGPLDPDALPVQLARRGTWILDRAAASRLRREARPA